MPTFDARNHGASQPTVSAEAVTPSDSTVLTGVRALYVGTGGNISVICSEDTSAVTLSNVASGTVLPISVSKVRSTSTTASNIVALK